MKRQVQVLRLVLDRGKGCSHALAARNGSSSFILPLLQEILCRLGRNSGGMLLNDMVRELENLAKSSAERRLAASLDVTRKWTNRQDGIEIEIKYQLA